MNSIGLYPRVRTDTGGTAIVSQAGAVGLVETVRVSGLDRALWQALQPWRKPQARHDPGKIVVDLALSLAVGGDFVLKVGRTVYVGSSTRTNAAGIAQLRHVLQPRGWTVVEVPVTRALHLKSAVTALPDGTIVGYPPLVDGPSLFPRFLPVPEAHGCAVVVLTPPA